MLRLYGGGGGGLAQDTSGTLETQLKGNDL